MKIQDLLILYDFNYWARDRILSTASQLSPEEFLAPIESNYGSLQATLVHILSAERVWRIRCQERRSPTSLLAPDDFPSLEVLRSFWLEEQHRMMDYLAGLEASALETQISYLRTGGQAQSNILWHILVHLVMHGTEHRSEAGSILTAFGHSPGDIDFIHYLRERRAA
ncbi:MAG: DinB family protein [Anaerolineales bacterium]|jgi:uncharacterized damage-inducible protein DinB